MYNIWTSLWVLHTPNVGPDLHSSCFQKFLQVLMQKMKNNEAIRVKSRLFPNTGWHKNTGLAPKKTVENNVKGHFIALCLSYCLSLCAALGLYAHFLGNLFHTVLKPTGFVPRVFKHVVNLPCLLLNSLPTKYF